ncbi:MAG: hypothetical protein QXL51_00650 [Candidatus Aenigmatarchaeota archaeon]
MNSLEEALSKGVKISPQEKEAEIMREYLLYEDTLKEYIKRFGRNEIFEERLFSGIDLETKVQRIRAYVSGIEELFSVEEILELLDD